MALKFINLDNFTEPYTLKNLNREPFLLINMKHPNIVNLIEVLKSNKFYCLVLEYISGMTLFDILKFKKRFSENESKEVASQLIGAISYMHSKNILHRDLKLENILIKPDRQITLIDFGLSTSWSSGQHMNTFCGSPEYAAPELYLRNKYYGPPCDIWSYGGKYTSSKKLDHEKGINLDTFSDFIYYCNWQISIYGKDRRPIWKNLYNGKSCDKRPYITKTPKGTCNGIYSV